MPKMGNGDLGVCNYSTIGAERIEREDTLGRFPANVILTYDDSDYQEVCGDMPVGGQNGSISKQYEMNNNVYGDYGKCKTFNAYEDSGSASRYFYCAKASKKIEMKDYMNLKKNKNTIVMAAQIV